MALTTTFVSVGSTTATATYSAPAINLTAGNAVIVHVRSNAVNITGITDTALNTYIAVGPAYTPITPNVGPGQWFLCSSTIGNATNVVKATLASSVAFAGVGVWQVAGAGGNLFLDQDADNSTATAGTSLSSLTFSTTYPNEIVCAAMYSNALATYTAGTGYTLDGQQVTGTNYAGWEHEIFTAQQSGIKSAATSSASVAWTMYTMSFGTPNRMLGITGCGI